eukprot:jgi/Botrbrau1/8497/Bobra.0029s0005.1
MGHEIDSKDENLLGSSTWAPHANVKPSIEVSDPIVWAKKVVKRIFELLELCDKPIISVKNDRARRWGRACGQS